MLGQCKDCRRGQKTEAKGVRQCGIDGKVRTSRTTRDCWAFLPKNGVIPRYPEASISAPDSSGDAGQIRLFGEDAGQVRERESQVAMFSRAYDTEAGERTSDRDESIRLFKD